ncbi:MAG TPA: DNA alkylation repair protein [Candidatus Eisenbacteria bacterium]|nr:DNA alkylation repair protein [Candidatus Eisenbacteria bacterium]
MAGPFGRTADSAVSAHAAAFVASREERAAELGRALADHIPEPARLARALGDAFRELADPEHRAGQVFVAPGIGPTHGVRTPLQTALRRSFLAASRRDPPSAMLLVADQLLREPEREARWFALSILERTVISEPERSWQLLRRAARDADDWITVDSLAHPFGKGILREPYRWAELEQLVVAPSRWERRLVGSTIATIPYVDRRAGRDPGVAARALPLLALLIGDAEPDVQKALSWGYRSMTLVDRSATAAALDAEAGTAAATDDGQRAWVIRDSLAKLDPGDAARLRDRLAGIRRRPGAPPTSRAAELAGRFAGMGLGAAMPEPPLA